MNFAEIYKKEYDTCNRFVLKSLFTISFFILTVFALNIAGVFVVKQYAMNIIVLATCLITAVSFLIYLIWHKRLSDDLTFAFVTSSLLICDVGLMYSFVTFHVILMFVMPALLYNIYGSSKLIHFVTCGTLFIMIASHFASYYAGVNPEEPFAEMQTILVFGLLPKMIIYISFMYLFFFEAKHNHNMVKNIFKYSRDMYLTQEELVKAFAEISESKSGQTGQHVKRVSRYVDIMARKLNIEEQERECFVIAAMMHDVGKLNIPTEILDKPGKLTDEEYAIIKKHTDYGYNLLKNSPGKTMDIAARIALNHHERWDGNGYNGLKGNEIDLYSRVMAVTDVFDALVSKRSYKEKWDPDIAYREIVSQSGKQFDPDLVEVFKASYSQFKDVLAEMPD